MYRNYLAQFALYLNFAPDRSGYMDALVLVWLQDYGLLVCGVYKHSNLVVDLVYGGVS